MVGIVDEIGLVTIDRSSLPALIEYLRRSEVIEALNQIQAMGL
jgi:hypothetical protein